MKTVHTFDVDEVHDLIRAGLSASDHPGLDGEMTLNPDGALTITHEQDTPATPKRRRKSGAAKAIEEAEQKVKEGRGVPPANPHAPFATDAEKTRHLDANAH